MAVIRALSHDKKIRVYYADISDAVNEISVVHSLNQYNKEMFGETAVGSVLLSADVKAENCVFSSILKCPAPYNSVVVVRDGIDKIKGYSNAEELDNYNFCDAVKSDAEYTVIVDTGSKNPYITRIPICEDSMESCISGYLEHSQQQKGLVRINCKSVSVGVLLQPVLNSEYIYIENRMDELSEMLDAMINRKTVCEIKNIFAEHEFDVTEEFEINAECDCTTEKLERVIISLGKKDAMDIINETGVIEITCPYCLKKYKFDSDAVCGLFK